MRRSNDNWTICLYCVRYIKTYIWHMMTGRFEKSQNETLYDWSRTETLLKAEKSSYKTVTRQRPCYYAKKCLRNKVTKTKTATKTRTKTKTKTKTRTNTRTNTKTKTRTRIKTKTLLQCREVSVQHGDLLTFLKGVGSGQMFKQGCSLLPTVVVRTTIIVSSSAVEVGFLRGLCQRSGYLVAEPGMGAQWLTRRDHFGHVCESHVGVWVYRESGAWEQVVVRVRRHQVVAVLSQEPVGLHQALALHVHLGKY